MIQQLAVYFQWFVSQVVPVWVCIVYVTIGCTLLVSMCRTTCCYDALEWRWRTNRCFFMLWGRSQFKYHWVIPQSIYSIWGITQGYHSPLCVTGKWVCWVKLSLITWYHEKNKSNILIGATINFSKFNHMNGNCNGNIVCWYGSLQKLLPKCTINGMWLWGLCQSKAGKRAELGYWQSSLQILVACDSFQINSINCSTFIVLFWCLTCQWLSFRVILWQHANILRDLPNYLGWIKSVGLSFSDKLTTCSSWRLTSCWTMGSHHGVLLVHSEVKMSVTSINIMHWHSVILMTAKWSVSFITTRWKNSGQLMPIERTT